MIKDKYLGMDISHYLRKKNFDAQHETLWNEILYSCKVLNKMFLFNKWNPSAVMSGSVKF